MNDLLAYTCVFAVSASALLMIAIGKPHRK